jgi:TonB-dependent SusC/RagA subfamily outer membrane receptor
MLRIVTTAALVAGFAAPVHAQAQPGPAPTPAGIRADTVHFSEIPDPPTTLMEGLAGRAAGLNVQWSSGSIGTAPRVWSRGIRSFTLNTYPLIVVDGSVIWPNPVQQMDAGGQHASVLDILDPEQFESITVLPGPAATARYGAKAAAGVIEIRTRRPNRGTLQTHAFAGLVAHSDPMDYPDSFGRMGTVVGGGSTVYCTLEAEAIGACTPTGAVHTGNRLREGTALRTDYGTRLGAAVNGGSELGGFRVAASRLDEAGVLLSNRRERTSVLLLGHATPLPGLRVEGAVTHGTLSTELPYGDNHAFGRIPNSLLQQPFSGPGLPQVFPLPPTDDFYRNGLNVDRTHLRATVDYSLTCRG